MMGVYCIHNTVTDKIYIGSAFNMPKRWVAHKSDLKTKRCNNSYLQRAYDKYGIESFNFIVLEEVNLKDMLYKREQHWMDETECYKRDKGYNICETAFGDTHSKESGEKISKSLLSSSKTLRGELHPRAVITEDKVRFILKIHSKYGNSWGMSRRISKVFNITRSCVEHIIYRRAWKNIKPFSNEEFDSYIKNNNIDLDYLLTYKKSIQKLHSKNKLTEVQVKFILSIFTYCNYNVSFYKKLAKNYGVTYENLRYIRNRTGWKHVTPYPIEQFKILFQEWGTDNESKEYQKV